MPAIVSYGMLASVSVRNVQPEHENSVNSAFLMSKVLLTFGIKLVGCECLACPSITAG